MSKQTDLEEATRRRYALALGSIPFECSVRSIETIYRTYEITLVAGEVHYDDRTPLGSHPAPVWRAYHDHDPEDSCGHITVGEGDTAEAAIVACHRKALAYDESSPE